MKLWLYQGGNFILTITRILPDINKKNIKAKRKTLNVSNNLSIYCFNTFDEYLEFCSSLTENANYSFLKKASLYLYKSKYYLCIYVSQKNINTFKQIHYSIIEFGTNMTSPELFERKLKEYGKIIFKTNAINNCIKHFN